MGEYTVKVVEKGDLRLVIEYDLTAESPRDWDNLGTMVCWHSRYNLGDDHSYNGRRDLFEDLLDSVGELDDMIDRFNADDLDDFQTSDLYEEVQKHFFILPVYMYEHSGVALNTGGFSCPWDSGQVGYIYVSHDDIEKEYGFLDLEKVETVLQGEVETYGQYVNGECYGFVLEQKDTCEHCQHDEWEEIDSCWGFIGSDFSENGIADYLPEEFKEAL